MPINFTNVIKPTHRCNLACTYCYNEDARAPIMSRETMQRVVSQTFSYCHTRTIGQHVDFIWHGGEPTIAGLSFFKDALRMQQASCDGLAYHNSLQTNGTLIDVEWARFLKDSDFRVSLSIDGPRELHDRTRHFSSGRGSFDKVIRAVELLRECEIAFGVCVVISKANADDVDEIFDFLITHSLPFNIIPLTRSGDALANYDDVGLEPGEYARPWIRMFDRWYDSREESYAYCSDFVFKTRAIVLGEPQDCIGQESCANHHVSTDPDGNVYPCATLSADDKWRYGNVNQSTLFELMATPVARRAMRREVDPHCESCKWRHVCHGGCMQRAIKFFGTSNTRDYYCESLYEIYEHIERRLREESRIPLDRLPDLGHVDNRTTPARRILEERLPSHVVRGQIVQIESSQSTADGR